jgi:hypothetical protein
VLESMQRSMRNNICVHARLGIVMSCKCITRALCMHSHLMWTEGGMWPASMPSSRTPDLEPLIGVPQLHAAYSCCCLSTRQSTAMIGTQRASGAVCGH